MSDIDEAIAWVKYGQSVLAEDYEGKEKYAELDEAVKRIHSTILAVLEKARDTHDTE